MKNILCLTLFSMAALAARAELVTLTLDTTVSNSSPAVTINDQQTIQFKGAWGRAQCGTQYGTQPALVWNIHGLAFTNNVLSAQDTTTVFTGPASVYVTSLDCDNKVAATFEIQPSAFPPDKAVTIGAYSGNVKVTMEESTDLVNWTPAVNGQVHTNSPDARFFRIRMEKNAPPPP